MDIPKDNRFVNLIGKKFGRLKVLSYESKNKSEHMWLCRCNCGNEKIVRGGNLKNKHTTSCGCAHREFAQGQLVDLTGKRFGRVVVIKYGGKTKTYDIGTSNHKWLCKCDCGKEALILGQSLRKGSAISCGCYHVERLHDKLIDLVGKKFGRLKVIKFDSIKTRGQPYWLCKCECGKEKVIAGNNLRNGKSKSCGCRRGRFTHGLSGKPGYKAWLHKDPIRKLRHSVSNLIRVTLKNRNLTKNGVKTFDNLSYTIADLKKHLESLWEPWMNWDNYAGSNNNPRKTWQIDHIKPQFLFPYKSLQDPLFKECWDLSNLRPLEKTQNMSKGKKFN